MSRLRDYQQKASDGTFTAWEESPTTLLVMPTGCGKTQVFTDVIRRCSPKRAIVLAHREELIWQARNRIEQMTGLNVEVEMADLRATDSFLGRPDVVVTTVQTQCAGRDGLGRMTRFKPNDFGLLVIDEAHHATADSYGKVIAYYRQNPDLKVLGVTATPDRADEEALGKVFGNVAFDYEILDAIHEGWLVPIDQQMVNVGDLDFSEVRTTAGDLNGADLAAIMESEGPIQSVIMATVEAMFKLPPNSLAKIPVAQWWEACQAFGLDVPRRTLAFASSVRHAEMMAEILNRVHPGLADWICGATPKEERRQKLQDFDQSKTAAMINCAVLTEGYDSPGVQVIVMARPTKSRSLYCLDEQTEILTPTGWKKEIAVGELVAGFHPDTGLIEFVPAVQTTRRPVLPGEKWVSIKSQCADIRVTNNHRMLYDHSRRTGWKFKTADELQSLSTGAFLPVAGVKAAKGVPLSDDEIRFIGWVMTDGTINKHTNAIAITQGEHQPWLEEIQRVIDSCGFKNRRFKQTRQTQFNQTSDSVCWTISFGKPRGTGKHLRGWGALLPYMSKDLHPALMQMTAGQFEIFAEALHLGDGHKQKSPDWTQRSYHISTGNVVMADRLQALAVTSGWRCSVARHHYNANPLYVVHLKKQNFVRVGSHVDTRPVFKKEEPRLGEQCWCVQNDIGTIVTRRNGKVCIVGNSQMVGRSTRPLPGLVDPLPTAEERRAAIAASLKPSCLVIDFVGNSGRHKLMSSADILGGKVSEEAIERALKKAKEEGKAVRMDELLDKSEAEIQAEIEERRRLEEARKARLVGKARYTTHSVNPFDVLQLQPVRERGWDAGKTLSEKQRALLNKQGIDPDSMPYSQAKAVLNELFRRWSGKLCTFKQAKLLGKWGFDPKTVTMQQATDIINSVAANNWRPPSEEQRNKFLERRQAIAKEPQHEEVPF